MTKAEKQAAEERAKKAAYARQWRREHPEQQAQIQRRYWLKQLEKLSTDQN